MPAARNRSSTVTPCPSITSRSSVIGLSVALGTDKIRLVDAARQGEPGTPAGHIGQPRYTAVAHVQQQRVRLMMPRRRRSPGVQIAASSAADRPGSPAAARRALTPCSVGHNRRGLPGKARLCPERLRAASVDTDPIVQMSKVRGAAMISGNRPAQQRQRAAAVVRRGMLDQLPAGVGAIGSDQVRPQPAMASK